MSKLLTKLRREENANRAISRVITECLLLAGSTHETACAQGVPDSPEIPKMIDHLREARRHLDLANRAANKANEDVHRGAAELRDLINQIPADQAQEILRSLAG